MQAATSVIARHRRGRHMSHELHPKYDPRGTMVYQIRVKGHLGPQWTDWFDGLAVTLEDNGDTLLSGPVTDQAALHGLLKKVRDLALPLLSVQCVEHSEAEAPNKTHPLGPQEE